MAFQPGNKYGSRTNRQPEMSEAEASIPLTVAQHTLVDASKALDAREDELSAARGRLAELDQIIGVKIADDTEANMEILERQTTHARIQQLESATSVLRQRKDDAEAAVRLAVRQADIEKEVEALTYLKLTVAPKVDSLIDQIEHVTAELITALEQARVAKAGGDHNSFLVTAKLELYRFANRALCPVTGTGAVPDGMMQYTRWSECIPDPSFARTRRRP